MHPQTSLFHVYKYLILKFIAVPSIYRHNFAVVLLPLYRGIPHKFVAIMNDSESAPSTSNPLTAAGNTPPAHAVAAVSLKCPPFWPNDPTVWFAQVEAQFLTRNITSQTTKFAYVISALTPDIAQEIRDLLISPPTANPYNTLKTELIKRTSASEQNGYITC